VYFVGCDLGSTTGKVVFLEAIDGEPGIAAWAIEPSGLSPTETAEQLIDKVCAQIGASPKSDIKSLCSTGYGRTNIDFVTNNVSEISCHARGAYFLHPKTRTIIDIGGQDLKVIALKENGKVADFVMNDKCAAGTGRFFEAMARTLHCTVPELGQLSLESENPVQISNTCSVFAESEVISHINNGVNRCDIAGGIHESIARRLAAMLQRVGMEEDLVTTGGCAKNRGLLKSLMEMLGVNVVRLPHDPQIAGALGAALYAYDSFLETQTGIAVPSGSTPEPIARNTEYDD
jgi:predicted CoA-substrate-specific enzyme activase